MRWILLVFALTLPLFAGAQSYPAKAVRIICPFPPGGGVDITARAIAAELTKGPGSG